MTLGYDKTLWDILSQTGWHEVVPIPDEGRVFVRDGTHRLTVKLLDDTLKRHAWCRTAMLTAFAKGAVGWQITEMTSVGGAFTLRFIPEWPDAVTALGRVSADRASTPEAAHGN
jgi:hypothetical protein